MLALLVAVAALEEVLFRGVLVDLCLALRRPAVVSICLAGTVAVFALSHVHWGWSEVLAKAGLGTLALLSVMSLETVAPAVVAHVVFNTSAWLAARGAVRSS